MILNKQTMGHQWITAPKFHPALLVIRKAFVNVTIISVIFLGR